MLIGRTKIKPQSISVCYITIQLICNFNSNFCKKLKFNMNFELQKKLEIINFLMVEAILNSIRLYVFII